jgi:hypothetical protein
MTSLEPIVIVDSWVSSGMKIQSVVVDELLVIYDGRISESVSESGNGS